LFIFLLSNLERRTEEEWLSSDGSKNLAQVVVWNFSPWFRER
jgi:hypothetical protein